MDKSLEKGDQGLSKDSKEGSIVTNEMDKTDEETEIKGTDNQFVVHGVDGPFLMDKSRWPNLVSSADEGSQDQEGMEKLTQEEETTTLGDIQLSANREISPPNNRKSPEVEKNEDTGSTIRATGKEEESKNIGKIEKEDFMDHLSDQSKISDMENDCQGWQSPKSKKKKKRQIVVATRTNSRVPRDGIPIATKAINRAKDKNNTSGTVSGQNPFTVLNNTDTSSLKNVILDLDIEVKKVEDQIDVFRVEELARAAIAEANYKVYLEKQKERQGRFSDEQLDELAVKAY